MDNLLATWRFRRRRALPARTGSCVAVAAALPLAIALLHSICFVGWRAVSSGGSSSMAAHLTSARQQFSPTLRWATSPPASSPVQAATSERRFRDEFRGLEEAMTRRRMGQMRQVQATGMWRKADKPRGPPVKSDPLLVDLPVYSNITASQARHDIELAYLMTDRDVWKLYQQLHPARDEDWGELMHPLELLIDKMERAYRIIRHIKDVVDPSPEFQRAAVVASDLVLQARRRNRRSEKFLPKFKLFLRRNSTTEAQRRAAASQLILFEQDGVNLQEFGSFRNSLDETRRFLTTHTQLVNASLAWDQNIREDMAKKSFLVRDPKELEGVPFYVLQDAAAAAVQYGYAKATSEKGPWMITLDDAMLEPILCHARSRALRERLHRARKRVAFLGGMGKGDNAAYLGAMLELRYNYSNILGYANFAEMKFAMKMATLPQAYIFLDRIRQIGMPVARRELRELQDVAQKNGADYEVDHFDIAYWRNQLIEERFSLGDDFLRPYFPLSAVLDGLFGLLRRLFGVEVVAGDGEAPIWDSNVRFFRVMEDGETLAVFYMDLHRRRGRKRPGFWVDVIQDYSDFLGFDRDGPRRPAVHVIGDLAPPASGGPSLLTFGEVGKLFHVMGQALRHLLCRQGEGLVSGVNGLEHDVVELPAHFLERWVFDRQTLRMISRHVETGDPLPDPAIETIVLMRGFHGAIPLLRRAALAQIDLSLHIDLDESGSTAALDTAKLIEAEFSVLPPRMEEQEICGLPINKWDSAVGLYSSLWSEALASDIYAEFEYAGGQGEAAVVELGRQFRKSILEPGGGRNPLASFRDFLGRLPDLGAFFEQNGLVSVGDAEAQFEEIFEEPTEGGYVAYTEADDEWEDEEGLSDNPWIEEEED